MKFKIFTIIILFRLGCDFESPYISDYYESLSEYDCGLNFIIVIQNSHGDSDYLLKIESRILYSYLQMNAIIENKKDYQIYLKKLLNSIKNEKLINDLSEKFNTKIYTYEKKFQNHMSAELTTKYFDSQRFIKDTISQSNEFNSLLFELQKNNKLLHVDDMSGFIRYIEVDSAILLIKECKKNLIMEES